MLSVPRNVYMMCVPYHSFQTKFLFHLWFLLLWPMPSVTNQTLPSFSLPFLKNTSTGHRLLGWEGYFHSHFKNIIPSSSWYNACTRIQLSPLHFSFDKICLCFDLGPLRFSSLLLAFRNLRCGCGWCVFYSTYSGNFDL